ncbi:MAG: sigma-70 family RNA polymerase sigma factor [Bacteroidales bacterium]|nr:sigma-70 family RNA polymerase sigma factor [Bacteroidales bacterium]
MDDLKTWVEEYTPELYKWAYYKTSSVETAEDLVQETFLAAAEKIETFKGASSPKTWLFSILNHKIIDFYRKSIVKPAPLENNTLSNFFDSDGNWQQERSPRDWEENDTHLLDNTDFQAILQKCLDALPEQWSLCVKLKYLSEKSGDEICQELVITPTNYWQIVHRAKLQLRNCVENNWFKN